MTNIESTAHTPAQEKLVQEKVVLLKKARDLQTQLAKARAGLTDIDQRMLNEGFKIPVLACW
jgi:hypothetical protein